MKNNYRMSDSAPLYALIIVLFAAVLGGGAIAAGIIAIIRSLP